MYIPVEVLSEFYPLRKLMRIGYSYALVVPKEWVNYYCEEIEGEHWVAVNFDGKEVTIKSIGKQDLTKMQSAVKVKPNASD